MVYDVGRRSVLLLDSLGLVVRVKSLADRFWASVPVASDVSCRLYFEGQQAVGPEADSAQVFRWDPGSGESTAVFRIRATKRASYVVTQRSGTNVSRMEMLLPQPFSDGDEWGVVGDSAPVLVSNGPGLVNLRVIGVGTLTKSWAFHPDRIKVTDEDRTGASSTGWTVNWSFPEYKPPLVDGSAFGSFGGPMIVGLQGTAGDSSRYLIVGSNLTNPGLLVLAAATQVVGMGARTVYVATEDSIGLLTLSGVDIEQ